MVLKRRHILKALTYRILATIITTISAWIVTGDLLLGFSIGAIEIVSKLFIYYIHEMVWSKSLFGIKDNNIDKGKNIDK